MNYLNQSDLLSQGWTKKLIDDFLPRPILRENPHYRRGSPMKLWDSRTVAAVSNTPAFISAKSAADKRRRAPPKGKQNGISEQIREIVRYSENTLNDESFLFRLAREADASSIRKLLIEHDLKYFRRYCAFTPVNQLYVDIEIYKLIERVYPGLEEECEEKIANAEIMISKM